MGNLTRLLLDGDGEKFVTGLLNVISLVMTAVAAAGVFYAFFLFYLMATASTEDKRRAVKGRIVNVLASLLIIVALVAVLIGIKTSINFTRVSGSYGTENNTTEIKSVTMTFKKPIPAVTISGTVVGVNPNAEEKMLYTYGTWDNGDYKLNTKLSGTQITIDRDLIQLTPATNSGSSINITADVTKITSFKVATRNRLAQKYWKVTRDENSPDLKVEYLCYSHETLEQVNNGPYYPSPIIDLRCSDRSGNGNNKKYYIEVEIGFEYTLKNGTNTMTNTDTLTGKLEIIEDNNSKKILQIT